MFGKLVFFSKKYNFFSDFFKSCTFTALLLLLFFFQQTHYYAANFVFYVSFRRGSKRKKNIQKKKGHFERSSLFCFRPFPETTFLERPRCRGAVLSSKKRKRLEQTAPCGAKARACLRAARDGEMLRRAADPWERGALRLHQRYRGRDDLPILDVRRSR